MDLNHDNQVGARTDLVRDQALPALRHVGMALTPFDSDLDGLSCDVATALPPCLVFPAGVA